MSNKPPPQTLTLAPGETMPNSRLPVLIYRSVEIPNGGFKVMFSTNGWVGVWRDGVYDFHHYHSNAHEVLGVEAGNASLQLGGPEGQSVDVSTGDVVVLPAGTGHCRLHRSDDFMVVGAYPRGQDSYDLLRTRTPEAELRISKVTLPDTDPVHGADGPLLTFWI